MDPNQHKYSFQDQNQVSYSNQPSIPTEKQSFGVPQSVDQPYQSSRYIQPDQTIRKYIFVILPQNNLPSRYHSSNREYQPYSDIFVPEVVSEYISQDRSGEIHLSADLNKMLSLGKWLFILAILEIIGYCNLVVKSYMNMDKQATFISIVCIYASIIFIKGYMKLDVNRINCYTITKRIITFLGIIFIVFVVAFIYFSPIWDEELPLKAMTIICVVFFNV